MKKYFKYAFLSAIALTGAVSFTACSSSDDVAEDLNPTYNAADNTVKTQFTISFPSKIAGTRMAATEAPENGVFRGMDNIVLIPFDVQGAITSTSKRLGGNIVLPNTPNPNVIATSGLNSGNNSKLFNDVTIPVGTYSFLLYAKAIDGTVGNVPSTDADKHKYGILTASELTGEPSSFSFTPVKVYATEGTPAKASNIAAYLTDIASATGWSSTTNAAMAALYTAFTSNTAGSSNSVKSMVADLYKTLYLNTDDLSKAIVTKILTKCTVPATPDGTISSWDASIDNYPTELNLPDGAASVSFASSTFSVANGTIYNNTPLQNYVYPASLYYYVNSRIKTDTESKASQYTSQPTWADVLGQYTTDDGSVQPNTKSVAIKNQINYSVAKFDVTVKNADNTLYDYRGDAINVTAGFPVTAVFIGGQKEVDFEFKPSDEGVYVIYDNAVAASTKATTAASAVNHTLVLESYAGKSVQVVVELTNDCADFYGKDGQLIKKDSKFYMLATLSATEATETGTCVFKQDYTTTANFTIKVGTPKSSFTDPTTDHNDQGLGNAYNVIPDLRTPSLELGMSVDLNWQAGHTYNKDFQ